MHTDTLRKYSDTERRLISTAEERAYNLPLSHLDSEAEINEWLALNWPLTSDCPPPYIKG
jgi:hypothetical protein